MRLTSNEIGQATGGHWTTIPDAEINGLVIDSREVKSGDLFAAFAGDRTDGHDYLPQAAASGAAAALVTRSIAEVDLPQLVVTDVQAAMGQIGALARARFDRPVIGLTGSNGKTTTKTMLASILAQTGRPMATVGNLNNELGVPMTLARLSDEHTHAVIEMGAGRPGDIKYLATMTRPNVGLITNAGPAHLEGMGTVRRVAATKGEIISATAPEGVVVLNADDDFLGLWKKLTGARAVITFGLVDRADVMARLDDGELHLSTPTDTFLVKFPWSGHHNAANAAAATAAAHALGIGPDAIRSGLESFEPVAGRLQAQRQRDGWLLIEDSYNANPASVNAAIAVLASHGGERWLVMGDMAELGPEAPGHHFQIGAQARRQGIDRIFAIGPLGTHTVGAFGDGAEHFESKRALIERLKPLLHSEVACLIKGSRSAKMEEVAEQLTEGER